MVTRRSWLQGITNNLKDAFGNDAERGYFFGIQLLVRAFGEDTLRARFADVIADPDGALEDTAAKRRYIKRVVALLLDQEAYWSQVFWDYKMTRAEADAEFESWTAELSALTATEHEEVGTDIDGAYRLSKEKDYVAVTVVFKLTAPFAPAELTDESVYWQTTTIGKLIRGLLLVDPETVIADGVFVTPGSPDDGLSEQDLLTGGWSYLRVIN